MLGPVWGPLFLKEEMGKDVGYPSVPTSLREDSGAGSRPGGGLPKGGGEPLESAPPGEDPGGITDSPGELLLCRQHAKAKSQAPSGCVAGVREGVGGTGMKFR